MTLIKKISDGYKIKYYFLGLKVWTKYANRAYEKARKKRFRGLSDAEARCILEEQFRVMAGYELNLDNPQSYNEKIQWLKLYYKNPLLTLCADKVLVRDFIKNKVGEQYLVPCLGIWKNPDEINFDLLPEKFAIKVNWGSGQNIICHNKEKLDLQEVRTTLKKWMLPNSNHYYDFLEWCYKDISPLIIAEKYIENADSLIDYKFYAFNGKLEYLLVCGDRSTEVYYDFYDMNMNLLPMKCGGRNSGKALKIPDCINEMKMVAKILSADFPHVRVDMYVKNGHPFVGELTFYSGNGTDRFYPVEWDDIFGKHLNIKGL